MPNRSTKTMQKRWTSLGIFVVASSVSVVGQQQTGHAQQQPQPVAQASTGTPQDQLATTRTTIDRLQIELNQLNAEAQTITPRREQATIRARRQARWLYHLTQSQPIAVASGPNAAIEHLGRVSQARRSLLSAVTDLQRVTDRASSLERDRGRIEAQLTVARRNRDELEASIARAQQQNRMAPLPVSTAGLAVPMPWNVQAPTVGPILSPSNTQAPLGLAPAPVPPSSSVTIYGGAPSGGPDSASFAEAQGRLLFPVAGRAEVRRVMHEGADGPGLDISCPLGSAVRAVYPGRIAFADRYGSFGRIVIVEHGQHYYTVSANLASINVRVGEEVATGAVLGTVGDDGHGPSLYFEVRLGSTTIDPSPWFGM